MGDTDKNTGIVYSALEQGEDEIEEEEPMTEESSNSEESPESNLESTNDPTSYSLLALTSSEFDGSVSVESLSDRIDRFNDDRYAVPFLIKEETFPVPPGMTEEPWTPGQTLRISYISWNMAHKPPDYNEVSSFCIRPNAHIVVVCTQENGSHFSYKGEQHEWEKYVRSTCLKDNYILVRQKTLWFMQLLVYARKGDVVRYIVQSDVSSVKTGIVNGLGGNKGGVAVSLVLSMSPLPLQARPDGEIAGKRTNSTEISNSANTIPVEQLNQIFSEEEESTTGERDGVSVPSESADTVASQYVTLLFIGAHLAPHQKAVNLRNKDYNTIVKTLNVGFRGRQKRFFKNGRLGSGTTNNEDSEEDEKNNEEAVTELAETPPGVTERSRNEDSRMNNSDYTGDGCLPPNSKISLMRLPCSAGPFAVGTQQELMSHRDVTEEFDLVLFGGDLNYRINGTRKGIEYIIRYHKNIRSILIHNDQLNLERSKGVVFRRFREGNLLFRPTYKYEIDHDVYNFSKKRDRMPAYCDRVLYKKGRGSNVGKVKIRLYTDVRQLRTSDHRPVVAIFDVETRAYI